MAATTAIHVVKYANDKSTILAEKTLTYQEMRDTLPVFGDGSTHYYHQGPVFVNDPNEAVEQQLRLNPTEDTNVLDKDMGAVMGTSVKDLCDLVGGMSAGDTLVLQSSDGMSKEFAYKNVYSPPSRQGPLVITWSCSGIASCPGLYPDSGYSDGMRLVFFADTSVNPMGAHVFGNFDWHESAAEEYWYYYVGSGGERYPTTTG
ncbi:MAG: argininosuccinate synthase, partial [Methanoregula sp.]|nr:argininosuccinate synthase [Methanoregula sp.]